MTSPFFFHENIVDNGYSGSRVVDGSKVPSAAGKTGTIKNLRKNGKVTRALVENGDTNL